jgi:hypothetical protein
MLDPSPTDLVAALERQHAEFMAMARSFVALAAGGGRYLGPSDCRDMAGYFEGKAVWLAEILAHDAHALRRLSAPAPAKPGRPRLVTIGGEPV